MEYVKSYTFYLGINISRIFRVKNVKFSEYCINMNTNI